MKIVKKADLFFNNLATGGTSDKEYHLYIEKHSDGYVVNFAYGRRGGTIMNGTKTPEPVSLITAEKIYGKKLREQLSEGYVSGKLTTVPSKPNTVIEIKPLSTSYPVELLEEINQQRAITLANDTAYLLEEKYDGHRRQIRVKGNKVIGYNKKGQEVPVSEEVASDFRKLGLDSLFVDGELVNQVYVSFDMFEIDGKIIAQEPLEDRKLALKLLVESRNFQNLKVAKVVGPNSKDKLKEFMRIVQAKREGVVFKLRSAPYRAGRNGQHKKFKLKKTCSAIVLQLRPTGKDSMSLGLLDGKKVIPVGKCSTIGKDLPKVGDVVEIEYLYASKSTHRLMQPTMKEIRKDVDKEECVISQLVYKQGGWE